VKTRFCWRNRLVLFTLFQVAFVILATATIAEWFLFSQGTLSTLHLQVIQQSLGWSAAISMVIGVVVASAMGRRLIRPIRMLAKRSEAILKGDLSVDIAEQPPVDEIAILNNTISRMVRRLVHMNSHLELLVVERTSALEKLNNILRKQEEAMREQNEVLRQNEEQLRQHNQELAMQEAELTLYIQRLAEQQQREKAVQLIVDNIRESLELPSVLNNAARLVGDLLSTDGCFITRFGKDDEYFEVVPSQHPVIDKLALLHLSASIRQQICEERTWVVWSQVADEAPDDWVRQTCLETGVQSLMMMPIEHHGTLIATLTCYQQKHPRFWTESERSTVRKVCDQLSIGIHQASLYTQAQESTRLKSAFLATMSHELRTPLNAIIGFTEMMHEETCGPVNPKQKHYLHNVLQSANHLLLLVNDILDLSKIESGQMTFQPVIFDPEEVVQESVSTVKSLAKRKQIALCLEVDTPLPSAETDPARLRQILYNLLSNAIKYTEDGGQVKVRAWQTDDHLLHIAVSDTGIGISSGDQGKIFQEFHQLDGSYARKQEGTGLGLSLTRKMVQALGGDIDLTSEVGVGSTFTVSIPCLSARRSHESENTHH
jgi:signal transduction histidine kinase/HAMP domain-containing protein